MSQETRLRKVEKEAADRAGGAGHVEIVKQGERELVCWFRPGADLENPVLNQDYWIVKILRGISMDDL